MKEIFCDKYVLQNFDQEQSEVKLKEDITGQSIIIGGVPSNSILLKLDVERKGYKVRSQYLRSGKEFIHKGCDYCLILPEKEIALLFELKSEKPKGYIDQFIASELFIEYCMNLWNKLSCKSTKLSFIRVLLSPKYNIQYTNSKEVFKFQKEDRCKLNINIISPGFPERVRLEKLI